MPRNEYFSARTGFLTPFWAISVGMAKLARMVENGKKPGKVNYFR